MYGTPEDTYVPPRHTNGACPKAPPIEYNLEDDDDMAIDGFTTFTPRLRAIEWSTMFKPAINRKYDDRSDPTIWLKTYSTMVKAANGTYDQIVAYFQVVMGPAPLLWLENLPPGSIDT